MVYVYSIGEAKKDDFPIQSVSDRAENLKILFFSSNGRIDAFFPIRPFFIFESKLSDVVRYHNLLSLPPVFD